MYDSDEILLEERVKGYFTWDRWEHYIFSFEADGIRKMVALTKKMLQGEHQNDPSQSDSYKSGWLPVGNHSWTDLDAWRPLDKSLVYQNPVCERKHSIIFVKVRFINKLKIGMKQVQT